MKNIPKEKILTITVLLFVVISIISSFFDLNLYNYVFDRETYLTSKVTHFEIEADDILKEFQEQPCYVNQHQNNKACIYYTLEYVKKMAQVDVANAELNAYFAYKNYKYTSKENIVDWILYIFLIGLFSFYVWWWRGYDR